MDIWICRNGASTVDSAAVGDAAQRDWAGSDCWL